MTCNLVDISQTVGLGLPDQFFLWKQNFSYTATVTCAIDLETETQKKCTINFQHSTVKKVNQWPQRHKNTHILYIAKFFLL